LCVLYVAMTRAIHRLDLIVQGREKEGGGLTYAAILRGALKLEAAGEEGVAWTHEKSAERWFTDVRPVPEDSTAEMDARGQTGSTLPRIPRVQALGRGAEQGVPAAGSLGAPPIPAETLAIACEGRRAGEGQRLAATARRDDRAREDHSPIARGGRVDRDLRSK
jgi:hypothetical protein